MTPKIRLFVSLIAIALITGLISAGVILYGDRVDSKKGTAIAVDQVGAPEVGKTAGEASQEIQIMPPKAEDKTSGMIAPQATKTSYTMPKPLSTTNDEKAVPPQSIVGIVCYYDSLDPQIENFAVRGSGVIISKDGRILTARHLIDLPYGLTSGNALTTAEQANKSKLNHCEVGQVDKGTLLATADEIRASHPASQVPFLAYTASVYMTPGAYGVNKKTAAPFDFVILKINGLTPDAQLFGVTALPATFSYTELLTDTYPPVNAEVLSYGFPDTLSQARGSSINTLYLSGATGNVVDIIDGITIQSKLDVIAGWSGSPLFYKGKVAGIITAYESGNVTNAYSISSNLIHEIVGPLN